MIASNLATTPPVANLNLVRPMPSGVLIGTLIGTCFALGWAIAGLQGLPSRWRAIVFAIALLVSALIGAAVLWRFRSAHSVAASGSFDGAIYGWAVTLESLAIVIAVVALRRSALSDYIMPTVAVIVGAHFFALARAMAFGGGRVFVWIGSLMCMSAASILSARALSFLSLPQTIALTGFSCAIILWASALWTLI